MKKQKAKSFILYEDYEDLIVMLDISDRGALLSAIFAYAVRQEMPQDLSPVAMMAFVCIKNNMDRDRESYREKCEKNAINGAKSHKGSVPNGNERYPYDNDNGNENKNDNDNDNDIYNGNGIDNDNDIAQANAPLENAPHSLGSTTLRETPYLEKGEKEELIYLKGVPSEYIEEREERAADYARKTKRSAYSVILEWWESDKRSSKWNNGRTSSSSSLPSSHGKSYDLDDFFAASLRRSYDEFDAKYGKD